MPEIGPLEILVVAVVALIVFGPEKLPEMGRKVGSFVANVRRMSNDMRSEFHGWMDDEDDDDPFTPEDESTTEASRADEQAAAADDDETRAGSGQSGAGGTSGDEDDSGREPKTRPAGVEG